MGYFKDITGWGGGGWLHPNFIVASSITIKFPVLIEFEKFSPK